MKRNTWLSGLTLALGAVSVAHAGPTCPNITCSNGGNSGRQVNISGATLFRAFFQSPASTNDFIDVDGDGCFGFMQNPVGVCFPNQTDQLAPAGNYNNWWIVQYRSVGSVNGLGELVTYLLCCDLPESKPTDISTINGQTYADSGSSCVGGFSVCTEDNDNDGILNASCTPVCPCSIDIAVLDVPVAWAIQYGTSSSSSWSRKPFEAGYGANAGQSFGLTASCAAAGPLVNTLQTLSRPTCGSTILNTNVENPDQYTLFDTPVAAVPIVPIANRGVGLDTISFSQLRWLQVTGRLPNGENLAAGTRDSGSGTRNGWCNSLGVDPSWGLGDNEGGKTTSSSQTNLGSCHRVSNCDSSSHVENAVQQRRLAIGYSGLAGSSAAAADAAAGLYEILNVIKDTAGGTLAVRPTVGTVLDNTDVNTGYQIQGLETFVTLGNPFDTDSGSATYMANQNAADYLRNISESIGAFEENPGATESLLMPGQYMANTFFLANAQDSAQSGTNPSSFSPQNVNQPLQDYIRAHNNLGTSLAADGVVTPAFGSRNTAGLVPVRDQGSYSYRDAGGNLQTIGSGQKLARRNRVAGDFNYDDKRDVNDVPKMMNAFAAGATNYQEPGAPLPPPSGVSDPGNQVADVIIVDVTGDFDGNGLFDDADIRYFADGLAISGGVLNRKSGFQAVDNNWTVGTTGHPAGNFFNTTITRPSGASATYAGGDSRFDIAGSSTGPSKGSAPRGANGVVNADDFNYLVANFGDWHDLDSASDFDLSADMNGDLVVDCQDEKAFVTEGWKFCVGDIAGDATGLPDGVVDLTDLAKLLANYGKATNRYLDGDLDCSGIIDLTDLAAQLALYGDGC